MLSSAVALPWSDYIFYWSMSEGEEKDIKITELEAKIKYLER